MFRTKFITAATGKTKDGFTYSFYPEYHNNDPEHPNMVMWPGNRTEGLVQFGAAIDLELNVNDPIYVDISTLESAEPIAGSMKLLKNEFFTRFTVEEYIAIKTAATQGDGELGLDPNLVYIWDQFQAVTSYVRLNSQALIAGLSYLATDRGGRGSLLTVERKNAILTP